MSGSSSPAIFQTAAELNARAELFADEARPDTHTGPFLVVIDGFYEDPDQVRQLALECEYFAYSPPDPAVVGASFAATRRTVLATQGKWRATAFQTYLGEPVMRPQKGFRHNSESVRIRMENVLSERIDGESWLTAGDGWNGAFHLIDADYGVGTSAIHHHFKPGDLEGRGWSGVVYLSADLPRSAGTSIWRDKLSGRCTASFGKSFSREETDFELAFRAVPRMNRLVLFRENVLHRAEAGAGHGHDARLTQTFFFRSEPRLPGSI